MKMTIQEQVERFMSDNPDVDFDIEELDEIMKSNNNLFDKVYLLCYYGYMKALEGKS